jgi:hypothetical protein
MGAYLLAYNFLPILYVPLVFPGAFYSAFCLLHSGFLLGLLFSPGDEGDRYL